MYLYVFAQLQKYDTTTQRLIQFLNKIKTARALLTQKRTFPVRFPYH